VTDRPGGQPPTRGQDGAPAGLDDARADDAGPACGPLRASAHRLDGDVDLVALGGGPDGSLWLHDGDGFAGVGVAARLALPGRERNRAGRVSAALAAIELDDSFGPSVPRPRAVGALAFDPAADAGLVVPAVTVVRDRDGARWAITVGPEPSGAPDLTPSSEPEPPSAFQVRSVRAPGWWRAAVAGATERIRAGELRKVVLAREIEVVADTAIDPRPVLRRLRAVYPTCYVTHVEGFVCASPELLVSRAGDVVRAQPMAGTAPRLGDPVADARLAAALLADANYRNEHQLTIDMVHDALLGWCSYLDAEPEPQVVSVANVQHLATMVEGRLSRPEPSVLELVGALHPTPAVGGDPRDRALALQAEIECLDRRRYAGPVGWVDTDGNGEWAVGIRCAELDGAVARVYAGNGIVADSDPATEYAETQAKLQAILGALVRP
jgi:menaquinone-specific isochorismate synthase